MLKVFEPRAKFSLKSKLPSGLTGRYCHIPSATTEQIGSVSNRLGYSDEELDFLWEESGTSGKDWDIIFDKFKKRVPYQKCSSREE